MFACYHRMYIRSSQNSTSFLLPFVLPMRSSRNSTFSVCFPTIGMQFTKFNCVFRIPPSNWQFTKFNFQEGNAYPKVHEIQLLVFAFCPANVQFMKFNFLETLDSQFSTLDSQFSTLDSQFSTLDSQLSTLTLPPAMRMVTLIY